MDTRAPHAQGQHLLLPTERLTPPLLDGPGIITRYGLGNLDQHALAYGDCPIMVGYILKPTPQR